MNNGNEAKLPLPIPSVGVGGVVFNGSQEVLLIKRNQAPAQGLWSLPGGRLEPGESLAAACQREFYEETNLEVAVKNIVAVVERKLEGFHYIIVDFLVELVDPENAVPIAQSDVADARWIHLTALGEYEVVEGLTEIILRAYNRRGRNDKVGLSVNEALITDYILPI